MRSRPPDSHLAMQEEAATPSEPRCPNAECPHSTFDVFLAPRLCLGAHCPRGSAAFLLRTPYRVLRIASSPRLSPQARRPRHFRRVSPHQSALHGDAHTALVGPLKSIATRATITIPAHHRRPSGRRRTEHVQVLVRWPTGLRAAHLACLPFRLRQLKWQFALRCFRRFSVRPTTSAV